MFQAEVKQIVKVDPFEEGVEPLKPPPKKNVVQTKPAIKVVEEVEDIEIEDIESDYSSEAESGDDEEDEITNRIAKAFKK